MNVSNLTVVLLLLALATPQAFAQETAQSHFVRAQAAYDKGDLDQAISEWREALRLKPESSLTKDRLIQALLDKVKKLEKEIAAVKAGQKEIPSPRLSRTVDVIADEFLKNSMVARQFYEKKRLLVYGIVSLIDEKGKGSFVELRPADSACKFRVACIPLLESGSDAPAQFARLRKDEIVAIEGEVMVCHLESLTLRACTVDKVIERDEGE